MSVTLGGSTEPGLTRVEIVGVFTAPGSVDDQLLVGLETPRHLAGVGDGQVQFIRAAELPNRTANGAERGLEITGLRTDGPVVAGQSVTPRTTVRNLGPATTNTTVTVQYRGMTCTRSISVPATATRTVSVSFPAGELGRYALTAAE